MGYFFKNIVNKSKFRSQELRCVNHDVFIIFLWNTHTQGEMLYVIMLNAKNFAVKFIIKIGQGLC